MQKALKVPGSEPVRLDDWILDSEFYPKVGIYTTETGYIQYHDKSGYYRVALKGLGVSPYGSWIRNSPQIIEFVD